MSFKTIQFEIQLEGRKSHQKRGDKKDAIELAQRTVKKYPGKAVRIVRIISEYSEINFSPSQVKR
jgi:hypothetical protein